MKPLTIQQMRDATNALYDVFLAHHITEADGMLAAIGAMATATIRMFPEDEQAAMLAAFIATLRQAVATLDEDDDGQRH